MEQPKPARAVSLLREGLNALVHPDTASKVILDALDTEDAAIPEGLDGTLEFARGPIARALASRLGEDAAKEVLVRLVDHLKRAAPEADVEIEVSLDDEEHLQTRVAASTGGPLKVVVVARSPRLAEWLQMALGESEIAVVSVDGVDTLGAISSVLAPQCYIVDGQNSADVTPDRIAEALVEARGDPLLLVWASEQPGGDAVIRALTAREAEVVRIPRREGVDLLLDYLRATMAGADLAGG